MRQGVLGDMGTAAIGRVAIWKKGRVMSGVPAPDEGTSGQGGAYRAIRFRQRQQAARRGSSDSIEPGAPFTGPGAPRSSAKTASEPNVFERRRLELAKYDAIEDRLLADLHAIRPMIANGAVVLDPLTREPLIDRSVNLPVVDRILRVSYRRAMVLGIDAPRRREVKVVTGEMVEVLIRDMEADAERLEAFERERLGEGND
jgi:hypothetical protein